MELNEILPELDDQPKRNYWAPELNELFITPEEMAKGNELGKNIDIENDRNAG